VIRYLLAVLIATTVALSFAIYALGYTDSDRCHEPMAELRETMLINRPECAR
jgi:hypothetical protein